MPPNDDTSYDVDIWSIVPRPGKRGTAYRLRWKVAKQTHSKTYATRALADSRRSELISAARRGEAFEVASGLPVSMVRVVAEPSISWWDWALTYVDEKWATLAPTSRRTSAQELSAITMALLSEDPPLRLQPQLRSAMVRWAFNASARRAGPIPTDLAPAVDWLSDHTLRLDELDRTRVRETLTMLARKLDGTVLAGTGIARRRAVFHNALELAVEREHLDTNPLERVRWRAPKQSDAIDPRIVATPDQARALLDGVRAGKIMKSAEGQARAAKVGERYVAFFGCMYYSALRPSEVAEISLDNLDLPHTGWGWLLLTGSNADIAGTWTDEGRRQARQLKHRPHGDVRKVPCPPQLTRLLHEHVEAFPPSRGGMLFRGPYGGQTSAKAYASIWAAARERALTPAQAASPLVRRPYDLRHSAVSTWLAAGVDSAQVAAWAGHSIAVLHRVYAHVLSGRETQAQAMIQAVLSQTISGPDQPTSPETLRRE